MESKNKKPSRSRRKILRITLEDFADIIAKAVTNVPNDAELGGMYIDFDTGDLMIKYLHESFQHVVTGEGCPKETIKFDRSKIRGLK